MSFDKTFFDKYKPSQLYDDGRYYLNVAVFHNEENANRLVDKICEQLYPYEERFDHFDDVFVHAGHMYIVYIEFSVFEKYDKKDELLAYCRGFAEAEGFKWI